MDYSYPSVYFSYFLFFLLMGGAAWFLFRSWRHGYFSNSGEDIKFRMLRDE